VIVDLAKFVATEQPHWERLAQILDRREGDAWKTMTLEEVQEFDYLYRRTAADLARLAHFSGEDELRRRLDHLVARAYAEIHGSAGKSGLRLKPWHWLTTTLPRTFRRHLGAAGLAVAITLVGAVLGALAVALDADAKQAIMPFPHLIGDPAERVAREERAMQDKLHGQQAHFAGHLMTHNTRVALFALALGMTWGVGTIIILFYNGVVLGAVVVDYVLAGHSTFLVGWLLPHGVIEIPAILVGAQAGLVLAGAVLGRDDGRTLAARLRGVANDVATLAGATALMLVWAGVVESYLSQYHEPAIPYAVKIAFGVVEGALLFAYLFWAGRRGQNEERP
jgi:uncharacterized membrane protein SpoIIM required for sporulation